MSISNLFIRRPVATLTLMIGLFVFGCFAYPQLPISELPNVDFPTIVVSASLPGADPNTMATTVATPLEKQLSTISDIDSMTSVSTQGSTQITLQFDLSRDIDAAAQDVQSALLQAQGQLPTDMPNPPTVRKVNPADSPVLFLALTGNDIPLTKLDDYAENYISPQLSMEPGISQVSVFGAQQFAVRIDVNPYALTNRGMDLNDVSNAVSMQNTNQPTGTMYTIGNYRQVTVDGGLQNAPSFANAIINTVNGAPIRLKDIATVTDSIANNQAATWFNGQRAIVLAVQREPGANTVATVQNILNLLPTLTKELPGGAHLQVVYDRSVFIKSSLHEVQYTLLFAALLVAAVIFLFLNNTTSTLIAVISLPVSIVATFAGMYLCHFSLDNLSLMALVLAVGFVIDDAVVVLENITRHLEMGVDRLTASMEGLKEIFFTVISMTFSLVAVFIPIFFMGGLIGRLFNEFAAVVGIAILLSGVVSLVLIPMLCSRFLNHHPTKIKGTAWFEQGFLHCKNLYALSLRWAVNRQKLILAIAMLILLATGVLFYVVPKGFIPSEDSGMLMGTVEAPEGETFSEFVTAQQKAANIIAHNPNIDGLISSVGQGQGGTISSNTGRFIIRLKPLSKRSMNADQITQQLNQQLQAVAGLNIIIVSPPAIRIGGKVSSGNYQYVLQSLNWSALQTAADKLSTQMATIPGIQNVDSDLEMHNPELQLHILRDKAAALGVTPEQIENVLYLAYGQRQISTIMESSGQYDVIMEVDPQYQKNPQDLSAIYLHSTNGSMVPLLAVATVKSGAGPLSINHYGQLPAITISFNLAPGNSLGEVTQQIQTMAHHILPDNVVGVFAGSAQTFQQSMQTLPLLLLFTVLVIYMVLAILYEHFGHPLTILTALPFAAFGALFAILIFHQELDIFSFIGLILLVGLTKKNGIMMIDFALDAQRSQNLTPKEAIIEACLVRFRPIMMTTVAALVATLPMALGMGAGGETRRTLGITVVGGLLFSQLITLYITPVFYLSMDKLTQKLKPIQ